MAAGDQSTKPTTCIYFSVNQLSVYKTYIFLFPHRAAFGNLLLTSKNKPFVLQITAVLPSNLPLWISREVTLSQPQGSLRLRLTAPAQPAPPLLLELSTPLQRGAAMHFLYLFTFFSKSITALVDQP